MTSKCCLRRADRPDVQIVDGDDAGQRHEVCADMRSIDTARHPVQGQSGGLVQQAPRSVDDDC